MIEIKDLTKSFDGVEVLSHISMTLEKGKIYGLVGIGVGLSAVISYLMLFPLSHLFVNILMNYSWVYMAALFLEFGLVFLASGAARRNTPAALPLF